MRRSSRLARCAARASPGTALPRFGAISSSAATMPCKRNTPSTKDARKGRILELRAHLTCGAHNYNLSLIKPRAESAHDLCDQSPILPCRQPHHGNPGLDCQLHRSGDSPQASRNELAEVGDQELRSDQRSGGKAEAAHRTRRGGGRRRKGAQGMECAGRVRRGGKKGGAGRLGLPAAARVLDFFRLAVPASRGSGRALRRDPGSQPPHSPPPPPAPPTPPRPPPPLVAHPAIPC